MTARKARERTGPQPLPLHLALAGNIWLNWPLLWLRLQNGSAPWNNGTWSAALSPRAAMLQTEAAALEPDILMAALAAEGLKRFRAYHAGLDIYRHMPVWRDLPDAPVVAQEGTTCLRDYGGPDGAPALLVIPSLVNRYHILDLDHDLSFLRWLSDQGLRVLLVDWDEPGAAEAAMGIEDYIARLRTLLRRARDIAGADNIHILGHCLGGNLALALAGLEPETAASLILLATPWDFRTGNGVFSEKAAALFAAMERAAPEGAPIPPIFAQSLFAMLQSVDIAEKFRRLAQRDDPAVRRGFALVEDWLNDGVPLARKAAAEIIRDWYGANAPMRGAWHACGMPVRPRRVTAPSLLVIPQRDRIVPPASAMALAGLLPEAQILSPPLGHIGLIVSAKARKMVWEPVAEWIKQKTDDREQTTDKKAFHVR